MPRSEHLVTVLLAPAGLRVGHLGQDQEAAGLPGTLQIFSNGNGLVVTLLRSGWSCYPDPDLLIRTSGEMRLSNFLLWQTSYTEMYVTPKLWPDFIRKDLFAAVEEFGRRQRRYGAVE